MDNIGLDKKLENVKHSRLVKWVSHNHGHNKQALADLYNRLYPKIKAFIAFRVGCSQDVEDLVQDVFVELYKSNGWYDRAEDPEKYIFGIARNLIRQYYRKKTKSIKTIPIKEIGPLSAEMGRERHLESAKNIEKKELTKAIEEILLNLPPKAQQALKLRFIYGFTTREAAKKSGCTRETFHKRIFRALERIKFNLYDQNTDSEK
jgi:RNA polymerase sigma-70 factor (ECF subfamily)